MRSITTNSVTMQTLCAKPASMSINMPPERSCMRANANSMVYQATPATIMVRAGRMTRPFMLTATEPTRPPTAKLATR